MKMFLDEFKVLDMSELIAINGGYGSSSSGYGGSSSGYSGSSGGYGSASGYASSSSYDKLTSGLENWGNKNHTTSSDMNCDEEKTESPMTDPIAKVGSGIAWPLGAEYSPEHKMTSGYGKREPIPEANIHKENFHNGIDLSAPTGTRINSIGEGIVSETGYNSILGNYITVRHANGTSTRYAHCDSLTASSGDTVLAGQKIATVGSTGASSGSHLHLSYDANGNGSFNDAGIDNPETVLRY